MGGGFQIPWFDEYGARGGGAVTGSAVPAVSVAIPAYNRADTLPRALASVQAQTFADYEIVVVDDASTDDTAALLRSFGDPRLRCVRHETNRGEAAARNTAVAACRAPLIAWLDSDDEWLPTKIEEQVDFLKSNPAFGAVCTDYYVRACADGPDHLVRQRVAPTAPAWLPQLLLHCDVSQGTTLMVRAELALQVGAFDEGMTCYTDWDWLVRYARVAPMGAIGRPLARVWTHPGTLAARSAELSARRFLAKHRSEFAALGPCGRRRAVARRWRDLARSFLIERNLPRGGAYLARTFFTWPLQPPGLLLILAGLVRRKRTGPRGAGS